MNQFRFLILTTLLSVAACGVSPLDCFKLEAPCLRPAMGVDTAAVQTACNTYGDCMDSLSESQLRRYLECTNCTQRAMADCTCRALDSRGEFCSEINIRACQIREQKACEDGMTQCLR